MIKIQKNFFCVSMHNFIVFKIVEHLDDQKDTEKNGFPKSFIFSVI